MVDKKFVFESGGTYQCTQDTHLIDYKLTKKKSGYKISRRAVRIRKGDIILCLNMDESNGQIEAVFLVGEEIVHIQEHSSTLRALQKVMIKLNRSIETE